MSSAKKLSKVFLNILMADTMQKDSEPGVMVGRMAVKSIMFADESRPTNYR